MNAFGGTPSRVCQTCAPVWALKPYTSARPPPTYSMEVDTPLIDSVAIVGDPAMLTCFCPHFAVVKPRLLLAQVDEPSSGSLACSTPSQPPQYTRPLAVVGWIEIVFRSAATTFSQSTPNV